MADVSIIYKGSTIAEMSDSGTKTLKTAGKYCEGDIKVYYEKTTSGGTTDELAKKLITGEGITTIPFSLPDGITEIRDYAFYRIDNGIALSSLPSSVTKIGKYAFYNTPSIVSLPNNIQYIGDYAFAKLTYTSNVGYMVPYVFPSSLVGLGDYVIANSNVTTVTFEGTPTVIGSYAFDDCKRLTTINVPWSEGEVSGAPWGASLTTTINYNVTTS